MGSRVTCEFPAALVDLPVTERSDAIRVRRSTRTYDGSPVAPESMERMQGLCEGLPVPEVARVVLVHDAPDDIFTGVIGSYGRITGAPSVLLIIGTDTMPAVQESAGYLGEAVILEATTLGLGTCWVAGFFDRRRASELVPLAPGERVVAVSPLGYAHQRPPGRDRVFKRALRAHRRKPLDEIAPGVHAGRWPAWVARGVESAQLAPSAVNRQPWRFTYEGGSADEPAHHGKDGPAQAVTVSAVQRGYEGNISRRLDCGIAMLHFEIGARSAGMPGRWEVLEPPGVACYQVPAEIRPTAGA